MYGGGSTCYHAISRNVTIEVSQDCPRPYDLDGPLTTPNRPITNGYRVS